MRLRRGRLLVAVVGVAAGLSVAGVVASTLVRSPAQVAAESKPPTPSVLSAPVLREVVRDNLVMRATVVEQNSFTATPTSEVGASGLVVTGIGKPAGSALAPGDVIAEVSGRPLFVLPGAVPSYRALDPGESGKDVAQLQTALSGLGLSWSPDAPGTYATGTEKAVRSYYGRIGYSVPMAGDAAGLAAARDAVTQAQHTLYSIEAGATSAAAPPSGGTTDPAAGVPPAVQVAWARQSLSAAVASLATLQAGSGPMVPESEILFVPTFPASVVSVSSPIGAVPASPFVTVASGSPIVIGQLNPSDRSLVGVGSTAAISAGVGGFSGGGSVAAISSTTSSLNTASGAPYVPVTVIPSPAVPASLVGQDVEVSIAAAHSDGPVLAVPLAAIFSAADGKTYVEVVGLRGAPRRVAVATGVSGGGFTEVRPTGGGALSEGDQVVTGLDNAPAGSPPAVAPGVGG